VGDVGWTNWEEINAGEPGANFGWPFYEGGSSGNQPTIQYSTTPEAIAFYASGQLANAPLIALSHSADNINALIAGDIYLGSAYPSEYFGNLFFNDLGQGIVRRVSFDASGAVEQIQVFATGAIFVVQIIQGPDELLYYVDLDDGLIGRWLIV
jgi:glucose/arabinose dehydrogenase